MAKKMGRPSLYKPEIIDELCERLSKGEPMAQICRDEHMPAVSTISDWTLGKSSLSPEETLQLSVRVARAREDGYDAIANDCLNIADGNGKDMRITEAGVPVADHDVVQRARLRVDTRLKLLACWDPKRYGNKIDHTTQGEKIEGNTLHITREIIGGKP